MWLSPAVQDGSGGFDARTAGAHAGPSYNVRVEVLTADLSTVLGTGFTIADGSGKVHGAFPLSYLTPAAGWVRIVADEYGYGPLGFVPAPATVWSWVYVC